MHVSNPKKKGTKTIYQVTFNMISASYNRNKFNSCSTNSKNKHIVIPSGAMQVNYKNQPQIDDDYSGSLKITLDPASNNGKL